MSHAGSRRAAWRRSPRSIPIVTLGGFIGRRVTAPHSSREALYAFSFLLVRPLADLMDSFILRERYALFSGCIASGGPEAIENNQEIADEGESRRETHLADDFARLGDTKPVMNPRADGVDGDENQKPLRFAFQYLAGYRAWRRMHQNILFA